jgi:hypothetical protein
MIIRREKQIYGWTGREGVLLKPLSRGKIDASGLSLLFTAIFLL